MTKQEEFEKQMSSLKAITGDTEQYEKINSLIVWFRNEFAKRPEKYTGDHVPIMMVRDNAAKGYDLDLAIKETYSLLNIKFAITDKLRALGN